MNPSRDSDNAMPSLLELVEQSLGWVTFGVIPGVLDSEFQAWYLGFGFICHLPSPNSLELFRCGSNSAIAQAWTRKPLSPTWWSFQMLLVWITMVSPTTLIPISVYSVPNFDTVIHSNGKKQCSFHLQRMKKGVAPLNYVNNKKV